MPKNEKSEDRVDFIGIGAAKSGSSWVAKCLSEHPDIGVPIDKSLFFFNADHGNQYVKDNYSHYLKGIDWYLSRFPSYDEVKIRGEFGVSYLNDPSACKRIKKHFPEVKILVTLRNPVDMIYSLYWYSTSTVEIDTPKDFETSVEEKLYLDRGNYYKHLSRFYKNFPKENIYVILFDDIRKNPKKTIKGLYKFLGVSTNFTPSIINKKVYPAIGYKFEFLKKFGYWIFYILKLIGLDPVRNFILDHRIFYKIYSKINVVPKKYPRMKKNTRKNLVKFYEKDISKLEKLIGNDLSEWRK